MFTKGEWTFDKDSSGCRLIYTDKLDVFGNTMEICDTVGNSLDSEDLANAQLIAAAPDLCEALKHVELYFALVDPVACVPDHSTLSFIIARVLAKVEGK